MVRGRPLKAVTPGTGHFRRDPDTDVVRQHDEWLSAPVPIEGDLELMRCSTCGENLLQGEDRCPTCGAVVVRRPASTSRERDRGVRECTRCGYRGDGIPYFRKPLHAVLLAGVSFPTFGVGGLLYYAAYRRNLVCPDCGLGWEKALQPGRLEGPEQPAPLARRRRAGTGPVTGPLPPSGIGRRVFGVGLGVLAILMIVAGVANGFEPELLVTGSMFGMGGSGMFLWGWQALQNRRRAVLQGLSRKVLMLATERDGALTVTEVAAELDLSLEAAEKLMIGMDDGFRVRSDITEDGVIYYEFPELRHKAQLQPGEPA